MWNGFAFIRHLSSFSTNRSARPNLQHLPFHTHWQQRLPSCSSSGCKLIWGSISCPGHTDMRTRGNNRLCFPIHSTRLSLQSEEREFQPPFPDGNYYPGLTRDLNLLHSRLMLSTRVRRRMLLWWEIACKELCFIFHNPSLSSGAHFLKMTGQQI